MNGAELLAYDRSFLGGGDSLRVVSMPELAAILPRLIAPATLENQKQAYVAYSTGAGTVMPVQSLGQPPAGQMAGGPGCQVCVKSGYLANDDVFVTKVAGGGAEGYGNTGLVMLSSQRTLRPLCILQDNAILTEVRTAAAAALASRYFLPAEVTRIGIVGGSVQAIWQLRFLTLITSCRDVTVLTRSLASAELFQKNMKLNTFDAQWNITIATSAVDLQACQLIHTVTTSRSPVVLAEHVRSGDDVHVSAMGADCPGKRELGDCIYAAASVISTDSVAQSIERGEGQYCTEAQRGRLVEIGALLTSGSDNIPNRKGLGLTVFDSSGIALQDVCIAKAVWRLLI